MTHISFFVNSMPRDLTEFAFFLVVGFTAGSMGLIWLIYVFLITRRILNSYVNLYFQIIRSIILIPQENQTLIFHLVQLIQQQLISQKFSYPLYLLIY